MANVPLNSSVFTSVLIYPDTRSQSFSARDGNLFTALSGSPKTPQHDSWDDAIVISSDDESDYGYLDEAQSDFPSIQDLLAKHGNGQSSSVTGDRSLSATSGASGDSDAVTHGAGPDDGVASGWHQQIRGLECSALPQSASPGPFQAESDQGQPIPGGNRPWRTEQESDSDNNSSLGPMLPQMHLPNRTGNIPCEAGQIPGSDDASWNLLTQEIPSVSILGPIAEQRPSSHRKNTPCLDNEAEQSSGPPWKESPPRESTPCLDATSQSDDLGGQHVQQSTHRTRCPDRPRATHSDDDGLEQKSDDYGDSSDNTDGNGTDSEEEELDEEDDFGPPASKRRKTVSAIAIPKTTIQRLRSSGPASQSPAHGRKRSSRANPPPSRASHNGKAEAPFAIFDEWPFENGFIKCDIQNGIMTYHLRWDSCEHATGLALHLERPFNGVTKRAIHNGITTYQMQWDCPCSESSVKKRNSATPDATGRATKPENRDTISLAKRHCPARQNNPTSSSRRARYTPEDDALICQLKEEEGLSWLEIATRFPKRTAGAIQGRYYTKLKTTNPSQPRPQQLRDRSRALLSVVGDDDEEEWDVEEICDHRMLNAGRSELLVKWKGGEETWEPYENMAETEALDEYERLHGPVSVNID